MFLQYKSRHLNPRFVESFTSLVYIGLLCITTSSSCKKKIADEDIQDCDRIFNYYEDGKHYIRRDLIKDDGVWDYDKLLEDSKIKRSDCYPAREIELDDRVDIRE